MLIEQRGLAFDPRVVDCFFAHATAMTALRDRVNAAPPNFETLVESA